MTHTSGVASDTILGDLVSTVPPMLYGLSITETGTCFPLPRAGTPLLDADLANATHVSLLNLFGFFLFLCLLYDPSTFAGACFYSSVLVYYYNKYARGFYGVH